jgi:hypothetical protein
MFCFIQDRIDIRVDNIGESRKYAHLVLPLVDFLRILSWHNYSNIRANSAGYLNLLFLFTFLPSDQVHHYLAPRNVVNLANN